MARSRWARRTTARCGTRRPAVRSAGRRRSAATAASARAIRATRPRTTASTSGAQIFRSTDTRSERRLDQRQSIGTGRPTSGRRAPYVISDVQNGFANFIAPFVMDPGSPTRLLVGCRSLWRTSDATAPNTSTTGPAWAAIKPPGHEELEHLRDRDRADRTRTSVWVGHGNGDVWSTADGLATSPTWTRRDLGTPNLPEPDGHAHHDRSGERVARVRDLRRVQHGRSLADDRWRLDLDGRDRHARGAAARRRNRVPTNPDVALRREASSASSSASDNGVVVDGVHGRPRSRASIDEMFWSGGYLYLATHGRGMFRATSYPASSASVGAGCQSGVVPPLPAPAAPDRLPPGARSAGADDGCGRAVSGAGTRLRERRPSCASVDRVRLHRLPRSRHVLPARDDHDRAGRRRGAFGGDAIDAVDGRHRGGAAGRLPSCRRAATR